MIDYHRLKTLAFPEVEQICTHRDTMLYALGVGTGKNPCDPAALSYIFEQGARPLLALPSMVSVLGLPGHWVRRPELGIDWARLVHGEQRIRILAPVPVEGRVVAQTRITHVIDKGPGRGALVWSDREIRLRDSGALLAVVSELRFCRGDGGYSVAGQPSDAPPEPLPPPPDRAPDAVWQEGTRPEMALIYRLSGDFNPLHADPEIARRAGYDRPILHGLATLGMACRAVLETACPMDPGRLTALNMRFSAPLFPGETLRINLWQIEGGLAFTATSVERDAPVLTNGFAGIRNEKDKT
jgi:acyl dehydratase